MLVPPMVWASHTDEHRLEVVREELRSFEEQLSRLRNQLGNGARMRSIELLEEEIASSRRRITEVEARISGQAVGLNLTRTLRRGMSGEDVRQLQEFLARSPEIYPEGLATGFFGRLTETAVTRFQERNGIEPVGIVGPRTRTVLNETATAAQAVERPAREPHARPDVSEIGRGIGRGSSGDDVRRVQGFLSQFPDIYPEGLVTGNFGDATERGLRRFQRIAGLTDNGQVDDRSREMINDLMVQGTRKTRPKIKDVSPTSGTNGVTVTLIGTGFTPENNAIMVRGKTVVRGLSSDEGGTRVQFILPAEVPCTVQPPKACPIKVVNSNGISNARPFKLTMVGPTEPPPEPTPTPTPAPTPAPTANLLANNSDGPVTIEYGTAATISWSSTDSSSCSVSPSGWTGTSNTGISTGNLTSAITYTLSCSGPGGSASDAVTVNISGSALSASCSVSPTSVLVGQPVTWTAAPSGGTGSYSYAWSGTDDLLGNTQSITQTYTTAGSKSGSVRVTSGAQSLNANCSNSVTVSLPPPVIETISPAQGSAETQVTLIGRWFTPTGSSVNFGGTVAATNLSSTDGTTLQFSVPTTSSCQLFTTCSVSVTNANGTSNTVGFLLTQKVTPVKVGVPNGGEILYQGLSNTIRWSGGTDRVHILLVEAGASNSSDPTALIEGWISTTAQPDGSLTWDARKVCNEDGTICSEVAPGTYKIMALSEDDLGNLTVWNDAFDKAGNWDVSDNTFTIKQRAYVAVIVPNWGGIFSAGNYLVICWATGELTSLKVNMILLKDGVPVRTLSTASQGVATGAFEGGLVLPTDIPSGSGYKIRVQDASDPTIYDDSDYPFTIISAGSAILVNNPNGGDAWAQGFKGYIKWTSANITSQAVNINLLKGGAFLRTLASNVPQKYYWSTQNYSSGTFNLDITVPTDIPTGDDYTIEVADSANPAVKDVSDSTFRIVKIPDTLTVSGKFLDAATKQPIANYTYVAWWDGYGYRYFKSDSNGQFSFTATTSTVISRGYFGFDLSPQCYEGKWMGIHVNQYGLYGYYWTFPLGGWSTYQQFLTGDASFGDLPFWPMVNLDVVSDTPVLATPYYIHPTTGFKSWGSGSSDYRFLTNFWKGLPLEVSAFVKFEDPSGNIVYSPYQKYPAGGSCGPRAITYFDGSVKWEPYSVAVSSSYSPYSPIVGQKMTGSVAASGGVLPYTFGVLVGSLPPQVSLSSSGVISGTTTQAGFYNATVLAQDSSSVSGAKELPIGVRRSDGTYPPSITSTYPSAKTQYKSGTSFSVGWRTTSLASKSVKIDLMMGGSFNRSIATYTQTYADGWYWYNGTFPQDIQVGTDYAFRISDSSNPAVYAISHTFSIVAPVTTYASWNSYISWTGQRTISQYLNTRYATTSVPVIQSLRLYQKKPGETSANVVATFSNPCTSYWGYAGGWSFSINCSYGWLSLSRYYGSITDFPSGNYEFHVTAVDSAGIESASLARFKLVMLEKIAVTSPTFAQSPVVSPPKINWTVPRDWPTYVIRRFNVSVREKASNYPLKTVYGLGPYSELDTTASWNYDGPALDPTRTYTSDIWSGFNLYDSAISSQVGYLAVSSPPTYFYVKP